MIHSILSLIGHMATNCNMFLYLCFTFHSHHQIIHTDSTILHFTLVLSVFLPLSFLTKVFPDRLFFSLNIWLFLVSSLACSYSIYLGSKQDLVKSPSESPSRTQSTLSQVLCCAISQLSSQNPSFKSSQSFVLVIPVSSPLLSSRSHLSYLKRNKRTSSSSAPGQYHLANHHHIISQKSRSTKNSQPPHLQSPFLPRRRKLI